MKITASEYLAMSATTKKKPGRYGQKTTVKTDQGKFDSQGEYSRWLFLQSLEAVGTITDLERQVKYPFRVYDFLIATYNADFRYRYRGELYVEDYKGNYLQEIFLLKVKMMQGFYQITVKLAQRIQVMPEDLVTVDQVRKKKALRAKARRTPSL